MFEALRILKERNVPALLTMAGGPQWERFSGRYLESLLDQGDLRKSVKRVGRLSSDELLLAFHSHDLFLYQTMNDGSPRIVLEAMASGIPIIASHHPGIDVLDPGQKAIGFTEYGDAAKIADLIEDYMSNHVPWWERAAEGRRIVETRFTKVVGAAQYVDLYDRLLSGKGVTFAKQHSSR
jgi:glycosyltransferase involved in cell wall biosynthesis